MSRGRRLAGLLASERRLGVRLRALRKVRRAELAIRFAFGAAVSTLAGAMSQVFGARFGGLFLAFPAILPAALTLVERKEGLHQARDEARGAVSGSLGLLAFALVAHALLRAVPPVVALGLALLAWIVTAMGLYLLLGRVVRRRTGSR